MNVNIKMVGGEKKLFSFLQSFVIVRKCIIKYRFINSKSALILFSSKLPFTYLETLRGEKRIRIDGSLTNASLSSFKRNKM